MLPGRLSSTTCRGALHEAEVTLEHVRALEGWRRDSDGAESICGRAPKAETLYREITKVAYPGLDLTHFHVS